ncbi:uncharacterized protein LOC106651173 [Trichogramma pretiosum]|uniref:uncharacterized protein LOC106651173 n=1 Tax=Trichogramma pretiosum TaxID=7493 RepID=UPI0006C9756B|nr:uncharacterized protein LOC106651173 [Trichogramma pretiosum]
MKGTLFIFISALLAVTTARVLINIDGQDTPHLLGSKACTWGPSYWCQNLTTAAGCKATKHCIPNVWEKMQVPDDQDSVCTICKDMVQQARDQLESNQTQEDLKAVFEGSCALIYIQPIVKECDKLVDQFIPELVETLASQMNPSVVCSVAGLCNSAHIDKLLESYKKESPLKPNDVLIPIGHDEYTPDECTKCYTIAHHMEHKFGQSSRDEVLDRLLNICGQFSSFSDACSSIILTHFETIFSHLQKNLNANNVCHLSGQCSGKFHIHGDDIEKTPDVEIRPLSSVGNVDIGDDLPCKLCEQLVVHLRDLLVANTTEAEFEKVLEGLCGQTKSFSSECKAIVDEYYPVIYSYLTKSLNGNLICQMGGICPAPAKSNQPLWPLLPENNARIASRIFKDTQSNIETRETEELQLPLERMSVPLSFSVIDDTYCPSCEFVMNFIKQNVRNLQDAEEVRVVLKEIKTNLPAIKSGSEDNFLTKYEEAIAELIREKKSLSEICSLVAVCPSSQMIETWKQIPEKLTEKSQVKDKPSCPLCLFAVTKLYDMIKDEKTEESIEAALDKVCHELPKSLSNQCVDLVKIYSKELIQLLLSDMSPQEVCTSLKLCDPPNVVIKPKLPFGERVIAVPKNDLEGKQMCALCEYVLHYIQEAVTDPKAEDDIKNVVGRVCKKLPNSIQSECNQFVDTYGDALVAILAQEIDPAEVCPMIHLCPSQQLLESWKQIPKEHVIEHPKEDKPNCPLCLFGVTQLYNVIKDNKTEESIESALDKLCVHLPNSLIDQCESMVKTYSKQIIEMILADLTPQEVCVYLKLCDDNKEEETLISFIPIDQNGEIMSNEIPMGPTYVVSVPDEPEVSSNTECVVCEFVMQYLEKAMNSKKSKDEIEQMFHGVCNHLPRHMSEKCNTFVTEYAEVVIELLTQEVSPKEICTIIDLCKSDTTKLKESVSECALCQSIIANIEKLLVNSKANENIHKIVTSVCKYLPTSEQDKCMMFMKNYDQTIIDAIKTHGNTQKICSNLSLCSSYDFLVKLSISSRAKRQTNDKNLGTKPCTWGISYWCVDDKTAEECKATELCIKKGHLSDSAAASSKSSTETHNSEPTMKQTST